MKNFEDQGWDLSGQATATAKAGTAGAGYQGAISISPGVWLYQITENGLSAELVAKGTKYYRDDDLNLN